jgi:lysophospholipase L1-like esterase
MKIICIGDSITYGQNVRADEAWPAVLGRLTGHDVRNAGVCGDTTRLGLERFPKDVQLHRPDVVVIQFGHNDANCWETDNGLPRVSEAAYAANIHEMRDRVIAFDGHPIVLAPHHAPGKSAAYNDRLGRYWAATRLNIWRPGVSVLDDGYGLHPDPAMHEQYAAVVAAVVASLL